MAGRPFKNCRRAPAAAEILAFRLKARDHSRDPLPCQVVLPAAFFCGATKRRETTAQASGHFNQDSGIRNLNDYLSTLQRGEERREHGSEPVDQYSPRRIADAHPNDGRTAGTERSHGDEILPFRHENAIVGGGMVPDIVITRRGQSDIGDMRCFVSHGNEVARESWWQLRVDQESHDYVGRMTGWSTCCAAYSSAAAMSSSSRYGKSPRMSARLAPPASMSRISLTRTRSPRMHGRPPKTSGSTVMRSRRLFTSPHLRCVGRSIAHYCRTCSVTRPGECWATRGSMSSDTS